MTESIKQFVGPTTEPSRRSVLVGAGGLILALQLPLKARGQGEGSSADTFSPNAFVQIEADSTVTVLSKHSELGQGPFTGLATLVAEELDANWRQVTAKSAPTNTALYKNLVIGAQSTGGSTAISNSYTQMRTAGAAARAMLVAAAAQAWTVPADEVTVSDGVISHLQTGRSGTFGEFTGAAATQPVPENPKLKDPSEFKLIGKSVAKVDSADKSSGQAVYALDIYRPDMLTAVVAHPPKFGAKLFRYDATDTLAVPGVAAVKAVDTGVAVYAENTFAALKGRKKLIVEWDESEAETRSTEAIIETFRDAAKSKGPVISARGDVDAALELDSETIALEAEYIFPFLAHAPMEPLDAVLEQHGDQVEVWHGCQAQTTDQNALAAALSTDADKIKLNTVYGGGSFGRRAQHDAHFVTEAAKVFDASGRSRPVKFMWTREDDIRGGYYRPIVVHRLKGAIDPSGKLAAWDQKIVAKSIIKGTPLEAWLQGAETDVTIAEGALDFYYQTPNHRLSIKEMQIGAPVLWWRSVGHTHTAFAIECFVDELLEKAGIDAVEGRLAMLVDRPRDAEVLRRAAELAGWGRSVEDGHALGVAVHKSFGTYVAQIAEVSLQDGQPKVHNVWAGVDCGQPVNRNVIKAQIEGGIGYGLGAALRNEVTFADGGAVEQSNFHDYRPMRIEDMPNIHVAIVDSREDPKGIGEPGTPPIAPAVANALRRLTGQATSRLPFSRQFS